MKNYILVLALTVSTVNAQVQFDMIPGNFVRQVDRIEFGKGILSCVKPLMAEEIG